MKKICKNCKYYEGYTDDIYIEDDKGSCSCPKIINDEPEKLPLNDKAEYTDYEGYMAYFFVGKNFGCIHFKSKTK